MKNITKILLALPLIALFSQSAIAVETALAEIGGAAGTTLDSALSEPADAKPAKTVKPAKHVKAIAPAAEKTIVPEAEKNIESPQASADPDYTIHAGDVLQVTVWKEDNLDREVVVLPDGTIDFPLIGSFSVAGKTPAQIQAVVKEKLRNLIPGASVAVLVKAPLGHAVSVIGQVAKPGEIIMSHSLTGMQALSQAGGLTPFASDSRIIILRQVGGKETSIPFPYDDIISGHHLDKNITLMPGDVMVVPTTSLF